MFLPENDLAEVPCYRNDVATVQESTMRSHAKGTLTAANS